MMMSLSIADNNDTNAFLQGQEKIGPFQRFFNKIVSGSYPILLAVILAMIWANLLAASYHSFWHTPLSLSFGQFSISKSLVHWIDEALMALFFFTVGLEIKREILVGGLSSPRQAALPIAAAVGGMLVPATIFYLFNNGTSEATGWAIPMATDTETFTGKVKAYLNRIVCENDCGHSILMNQQHLDAVQAIEIACSNVETPLQRLEHPLQSWVAYLVLPLFALANSGLALRELDVFTAIRHPVTLGVMFGLVFGKPLGILSFTYLCSKLLQAPLLRASACWAALVLRCRYSFQACPSLQLKYWIFPNLVSLPDRLYPVLPVGLCWAFWADPHKHRHLTRALRPENDCEYHSAKNKGCLYHRTGQRHTADHPGIDLKRYADRPLEFFSWDTP